MKNNINLLIRSITKLTFFVIILVFQIKPVNAQTATLPMQPGMAAVTCFSGLGITSAQSDPNGFVMGIYDIREPDCDAAGNIDDSVTPNATENWQAASGGVYHDASWTAANLGDIFGIEILDNVTAPDIYVSSAGLTSTPLAGLTLAPGGSGGDVFKIDGTTGAITKIVSLPNTQYVYEGFNRYVGLGNLTYNVGDNVLYVTNHDNGLIYAIDEATGAIIDTYDHLPGAPDDANRYITQLLRMTYGIKYNPCDGRLYYAIPTATAPTSVGEVVTENTIFSVALNAGGSIDDASVQTELVLPSQTRDGGFRYLFSVISDIEFSEDCSQMLVSERTLETRETYFDAAGNEQGIYRLASHEASVFNYTSTAPGWGLTTTYVVGTWDDFHNSAGGSDYGYSNYGTCGADNACEDAVVMMGDALQLGFDNSPNVYGLQISDINGNSGAGFPANSYYVDLDGNTGSGENEDKGLLGDVDVLGGSCCLQPLEPAIAVTDNDCDADTPGSFSVTTACESGSTIEYSIDAGTTWSTTAPAYDSTTPVTVRARCINDADANCFSPETADITSAPEECDTCPPVNCINKYGEFIITKRRP